MYALPVHPDSACRLRVTFAAPVLNVVPASVYSAPPFTLSTTRKSQLGVPTRSISARTRNATSMFCATLPNE